MQWWIPDFPDGRALALEFGTKKLLFGKIFSENCMKMREIGPTTPPPPPIRHRHGPNAVSMILSFIFEYSTTIRDTLNHTKIRKTQFYLITAHK